MILLLISFVAGLLTVLAPCILPLLPVIIGGSLTGDAKGFQTKKVFTIVASLALSVIAFTLLLKVSTLFITVHPDFWKWLSGGIVIVLGVVTVFPKLWEGQWLAKLSAKSNLLLGKGSQKKSFWGDVIIGAALGPIFSTCSPTYFIVLATVLPAQPIVGIAYLLAYTVGLSLALFVIALVGQKVMSKLNVAADTHGWFKRSLGLLFILVGIAIITGFDKTVETAILDAGFFDVTKVEQRLLELSDPSEPIAAPVVPIGANNSQTTGTNPDSNEQSTDEPNAGDAMMADESDPVSSGAETVPSTETPVVTTAPAAPAIDKSQVYQKAVDISTPDAFINTNGEPVSLASLKGKVVLVEFWTYSCINCQRTIPYLNTWYEKYRDQGFEIVGIHTPEFAFEKLESNVADAVERFDIKYPVVLDNDYSTWRAYGNRFWPRKYLVDVDGYVVYDHIGEGAYVETEQRIQAALKERAERLGIDDIDTTISQVTDTLTVPQGQSKSPEVYFGSKRNEFLANGTAKKSGAQDFLLPEDPKLNLLYHGGTWNITREYAENTSTDASILFRYQARRVYMVAAGTQPVDVEVYQDGVLKKTITVQDEQLYELIDDEAYGEHVLELKVKDEGLQAFTFTFG